MPNQDLTPVEKLYLGVQLTRPLLRNITARVETSLLGTGVTVGQRAILEVLLMKKQATAPEITAMLEVKRQFVARELKELLKSGMIKETENPKHKRSPFFRLSENSERIIRKIRDHEIAKFTLFAECFRPEEIDAYLRIQQALNTEMNPHK